MPKVSVVMAVHNEPEHILDAAIQSILSQTIGDLELIICDDGSTAQTAQAIEKWNADARIIVIRNTQNAGAAAARNRAIALAKSEYIAIMDADDISMSDRLEKQLLFLEQNPQFGFVGGRGEYFESAPGDKGVCYWFCMYPKADDFLMTLPFVHASLLFRKESLRAVRGYREIRRVTRSEDYDMLLRMYEKGFCGANLPDTLYCIRQDAATLSRRKYRYRFWETCVKFEGFCRLGLMPRGIPFTIKPLLVGLIPIPLLEQLKKLYYKQ